MDKHTIFSHVIESDVCSRWDIKGVSSFVISPHDCDEENYALLKTHIVCFIFCGIIMWLCLAVGGSMEPVKGEKFVMI